MKKPKTTQVNTGRDSQNAKKNTGNQKLKSQSFSMINQLRREKLENVASDYLEIIGQAKFLFQKFHSHDHIAYMLDGYAQLIEKSELCQKPEIIEFHAFRRAILDLLIVIEDQIDLEILEKEANGKKYIPIESLITIDEKPLEKEIKEPPFLD